MNKKLFPLINSILVYVLMKFQGLIFSPKELSNFRTSLVYAQQYSTVKHGYNEHAYNEFTLTEKWFSFPLKLLQFGGYNKLGL